MQIVQVGFSIPRNKGIPLFSWGIRWIESKNFWSFTNSSHAYIRWYNGDVDEWNSYEASGSTMHFLGNEMFKQHINPIEVYRITMEESDFLNGLKFCIKHSGKSYSIKGVIQLIVPNIRRKLGMKPKEEKRVDGVDSQFCSEVVGRFLKAANLPIDTVFDALGVNELILILRELSIKSDNIKLVLFV